MVFSKLAVSCRPSACQPSSSVISRHSASTQGRWLKNSALGGASRCAVSKSSSRAMTGCAVSSVVRVTSGSRWSGRGGGAVRPLRGASRRAGRPARSGRRRRRQGGGGEGRRAGRRWKLLAVVAADQQVAVLRRPARCVPSARCTAGGDAHRHRVGHRRPAVAAVGASGRRCRAGRRRARRRCAVDQHAEEAALVGRGAAPRSWRRRRSSAAAGPARRR